MKMTMKNNPKFNEEFWEYADELHKEYKESKKRLSDAEIMQIFLPEAKEIIKLKIDEFEKHREEIMKLIKDKLSRINQYTEDEFSNWFAKHYISVELGAKAIEIDYQIARLMRMLSLFRKGKVKAGQITDKQIEQAKTIPITEIIERYITLKKAGKNYTALCPFHNEKHPSFIVFPDSNRFHCFSCQKSGDTIEFTKLMNNFNFIQAIKFLT